MMAVFVGLTAAMIAVGFLITQTIVAQRDARSRAAIEGDMLIGLQSIMQTMLEAESSQRGYVLTGDRDYLQPYLQAKQRLHPALETLRRAADRAGDAQTAERAEWIGGLANAKFTEMDRTVALTRSGMQSQAQMIVDSDFGRQQMDAIRAAVSGEIALKAEQRRQAFASAARLEMRLVPLIGLLGAAILALIIAGFRAERARATAAAEAEQAAALREANQRVELLARELNHRVKNLFSVILSIVALSGRKPGSPREVVESIRARIHALSLAHAASQGIGAEAGVELKDVIASTMAPYADDEGRRVRITGPEVQLPVRMVTPIGMIVHELATNAVKYGALSAEGGSVEIAWQLVPNGSATHLALGWTERGGPAVPFAPDPPPRTGFGSQMTALAARQLSGSLTWEWPATGCVLRLEFPLPER